MGNLWALTVREWKAFWYSPIAYVVGAFFLLIQGWIFWFLLAVLNDPRVDPTWRMSQFFFGGTFFFWICMLGTIPLLTMRTFSEEKRTGTLEILLSAPVTDAQVVVAKFLGAWLCYGALWATTLVYFLALRGFMALDWGPIAAGYLGTWLLGGVLISVGILASSFTRNQVIAGFMGLVLMILFFCVGLLDVFVVDPGARQWVDYFSLLNHFRNFSKGILDTRPVVLYLSLIGAMLLLTVRVIATPRWRS